VCVCVCVCVCVRVRVRVHVRFPNKETVANLGWFSGVWFSNYSSGERFWRVLAALPETATGLQTRHY